MDGRAGGLLIGVEALAAPALLLPRPGTMTGDPTPPRAVTLSEGFESVNSDPSSCTVNMPGWLVRNNSAPLGPFCVAQGSAGLFNAQAGPASSYLAINFLSTFDIGTNSVWVITPVLNFNSGAELRFWSRTVVGSIAPDRLEIRLSSAGTSSNVGTTSTSVGDFTTVLGTINPFLLNTAGTCVTPAGAPNAGGYPEAWCEYRLTNANGIPTSGSGRIAFRYFVTNGGPDGPNSNLIGIDTVSYDDGLVPLPSLSINDVQVAEGNTGVTTAQFTVSLSEPAASAVTFDIATANGTATAASDYTAQSLTEQSIPVGASSAVFTVDVLGDRGVEPNETFFVNVTGVAGATVLDGQGQGTIQNDDTAGITVTPTSGLVTTEAGGSAEFTVVLTSQPTADVGIGLSSNDLTEGTVAPASLSFTAANWNTPQTVTVTGVDDAATDGDIGYQIITAAATSTDPNYAGRNPADVSVTNTDNDAAGITVTPTSGLVTTEAGGSAEFTVVLTSPPTADVGIGLSSNDLTEGTVAPASLSFTAANWNTPQTVTVTGVDDAATDGDIGYQIITAAATSTDPNYAGLNPADVSVTNTDNDTAGITVTPTSGLVTTEAGGSAEFTVVLTSQPTADVGIGLSSNDLTEGTVAPASLSFTAANWNTPQTVTVTGVDDAATDGDVGYQIITAAATSTDPNYAGRNPADVSLTNTDNDAVGITVTASDGSTAVTEGGATDSLTLVLNTMPTGDVTVTLSPGDQLSAAPTPLTFTAATWNTPQTVTVTAIDDAPVEGAHNGTLGFAVASADPAYAGIVLPPITVAVTDNDSATVRFAPAAVSQSEAISPMVFTVTLSAPVASGVNLTVDSANGTATAGTDYTAIVGGSVSFLPNSTTAQTVSVAITNDAVDENDETFGLTLSNLIATGAVTLTTATATGTIEDDDLSTEPTTTTITADLPDPSVVGEGYPVTVEVRAQTLSPLGTVEISDGTGASCNAPLTAGTAPVSTMSCTLTSTSAGAKTLTASYTPASNAFEASSDTEAHQVNSAATSLVLLGPARARIGTVASYTAELSVVAPGAGTPAGTVTVTAGPNSCTIPLPSATPSCAITYATLGSRTVTASFAPSNGNYGSSTSVPVQTLVFASADVSVTKTNAVGTYRPGDLLVYTVVVHNNGPDAAPQVRVRDVAPAGLTNVAWTCVASGGAVCPDAGGTGTLDHVVETLPANSQLTYAYFGNVIGRPLSIVNVAEVTLPADTTIEDPTLSNNSATDTDLLDDLFADGFEAPEVNGATGSVRLAGTSLRSTLDEVARVTLRLSDVRGEALRVYARVIGGELQVALAVRGADGSLRPGVWQPASSEPELVWTASEGAGGFVLSGATLR